jgi:MoxR-like ATPase
MGKNDPDHIKCVKRSVMNFNPCETLMRNMASVIVGKKTAIELIVVALLAEGHVLVEDVPGQGKTLIAKSLARSIGGIFRRIQFTPDLLPSDITGFNVYNQRTGDFAFQPGPVMSNVLLADEINRTIPRTQSSLLESMEERQVTVDGKTMQLPEPFFVIATQNPIELEGTFPLPEAQLDRFLLRVSLGYPDRAEEIDILDLFQDADPFLRLDAVVDPAEIVRLQRERRGILVSGHVKEYIADIARATRVHPSIRYGVSPRASLGLMHAAQALAALRGRDYVLPDDVKALASPVLCHRLILTEEERLRGKTAEEILRGILPTVPIAISN